MEHPSELEDESEIAYVSAKFWEKLSDSLRSTGLSIDEIYNHLLTFQQGWKACKDFYKIEI